MSSEEKGRKSMEELAKTIKESGQSNTFDEALKQARKIAEQSDRKKSEKR